VPSEQCVKDFMQSNIFAMGCIKIIVFAGLLNAVFPVFSLADKGVRLLSSVVSINESKKRFLQWRKLPFNDKADDFYYFKTKI